MASVTVINHPLVQHKLTIMRDRHTSTAGFRQLLRETDTWMAMSRWFAYWVADHLM